MFLKSLSLTLLIFAAPALVVNWTTPDKVAFNVEFDTSQDACIQQHRKDGFELKYRFYIRACQKRLSWSDKCWEPITEIHDLKFDPVSEKYRVLVDRLKDNQEPHASTYDTQIDAEKAFSSIKEFPVELLEQSAEGVSLVENERMYLSVRFVSRCQGDVARVLSWIPYLFTFGIIERDSYDSGWVNFYIHSS